MKASEGETIWADAHAHPGRCFLLGLPGDSPITATVGLPDLDRAYDEIAEGGLGLACFSTVGDLCVLGVGPEGIRVARDFERGEAAADHRRQLEALAELATEPGRRPVLTTADIDAIGEANDLGVLIGCEGADFLDGHLAGVEEVFHVGARVITLVHYRVNELGDVQTDRPRHEGLTAFGREVVQEMNRLGMLIDLAHATYAVTRDVLDCSEAPVVISHSHLARGRDPHPRLLSREHALAVARSEGVVAAWPSGMALSSFDEFIDEILRMLDLLDLPHVAIGTDMDANYQPVVQNYRQFPEIAEALRKRGLRADEVQMVMGGNLVRLLRRILR